MKALQRELRLAGAAISFLTRLPVPRAAAVTRGELQSAVRYFPLVGVLVGALGAAVWWLARRVFPGDVAVVLSMAATILATGAFHEDGFTDVCDGFGGGCDRTRILAIMKDSRVGAFGVIGIVLLLGLKALVLMHVPGRLMIVTLIAGHAASRWAAVTLLATQRYARDETGKAAAVDAPPGAGALACATALGAGPAFLLPARCRWAIAAVLGVRWVLGRWFHRRIGGYTGDCLGALQQVAEVGFYLAVLATA